MSSHRNLETPLSGCGIRSHLTIVTTTSLLKPWLYTRKLRAKPFPHKRHGVCTRTFVRNLSVIALGQKNHFMKGKPQAGQKQPTCIKVHFAQAISEKSVLNVCLFLFRKAENKQKEFVQAACANCL